MICIAGKNQCAIGALEYLISHPDIEGKTICVSPNKDDCGKDTWQPSLIKFAHENEIIIKTLDQLYGIEELLFFSLEYDSIIKTQNFKSKKLYNFHFSLLPKYRGCHTNYLQIKNGEKFSGVTLHEIDDGIDTGKIIDYEKFEIALNDTSKENYFRLMDAAVNLFKKKFNLILKGKYTTTSQNDVEATYYSRASIDYKKELINYEDSLINIHNQIRALIFPPFQLPIVNGKKIIKSKLFDDHIILTDIKNNEQIHN